MRIALLPALASAGCTDPPILDRPFEVASVVPEDGDLDVGTVQVPELRLSAPADGEACDEDTVQIAAVDDGEGVLFGWPIEVEHADEGRRLRLLHEDPFDGGYTYGISIRSGTAGCADTEGRIIEPFFSRFSVP